MPAPVKQDSGHLLSANPVCDALETPARLVQAAAGPSNAFAGAGLGPMAKYLEDPPVATAHMNETKPVLQPASQTMMKSDHKPHENAEWLPRPISRPPPFQVAAKRFKTYSSTCDNLANCTDSSQHVPQPKGVTAAGQTIPSLTPRDNEHQAAPPSVQNGCLQQLASQINTARSSPHCYLSKPKGMNGPLMSRPQKRKAVAAPVLSSTPSQAATASIDLTMSDDDIADTISNNDKQTEAAPQSALDPVSCTKSLALMVQVVNTNLKEKPILEEQLQRLQNAVDSVSELESLEPQELTDVLRSVGKLNTIQMIRVRQHLRSGL